MLKFSVLTTAQMIKFVYLATSLAFKSDRVFSGEIVLHLEEKKHFRRLVRGMLEVA